MGRLCEGGHTTKQPQSIMWQDASSFPMPLTQGCATCLRPKQAIKCIEWLGSRLHNNN